MNEKMRILIATIMLIVMLILANFFIILPILSRATIDYGHPIEARWEKNPSGGLTAIVKFANYELNTSITRFCELIHIPKLNTLICVLGFIVLGITFLILSVKINFREGKV